MSSQLTQTSKDITDTFNVIFFTVILHEYTLTVVREIELFWKRPKKSWAFAFFVANRYITIFGRVLYLLHSFSTPEAQLDSWCNVLRLSGQAEVAVNQIVGSVVMIMRVYALYQNSRQILVFFWAILLSTIVVACWALFSNNFSSSTSGGPTPPSQLTRSVGCPSDSYLTSEQAVYMAAAWSGQLIFDIFIFLFTLIRSLRIRKQATRSIADILLRDGSLYFGIMCGANVTNVIVPLMARNSFKGFAGGFTNVISSVLISRLMLNLRDPKITDPMKYSAPQLSHANMAFAMRPTDTAIGASTGTSSVGNTMTGTGICEHGERFTNWSKYMA